LTTGTCAGLTICQTGCMIAFSNHARQLLICPLYWLSRCLYYVLLSVSIITKHFCI